MAGYEVAEDNRSFVQEGISGEVRRFAREGMEYPCMTLISTEEKPVEMHKLQVLSSMIKANKEVDTNSVVSIYYTDNTKTIKLGRIASRQVKSFLRLFANNEIRGMLNKDKVLEGMYLYVLAE